MMSTLLLCSADINDPIPHAQWSYFDEAVSSSRVLTLSKARGRGKSCRHGWDRLTTRMRTLPLL